MATKKDIDESLLVDRPSRLSESMVGKKYGRLTILRYVGAKMTTGGHFMFYVEASCECGSVHYYNVAPIRIGTSSACGCLQAELTRKRATIHGNKSNKKSTRAYRAWRACIDRCCYPSHIGYRRYGGRGIKVCDRWRHSFEAFIEDMGSPPTGKHTLDRFPNVDGDYEPDNCRWATQKEQCNNFSRNKFIEIDGVKYTLSQAQDAFGISSRLLASRLMRGWSDFDAFNKPVRKITKRHQ